MSTWHYYECCWLEFEAFAENGLVMLPVSEDTVGCFLVWLDLAG